MFLDKVLDNVFGETERDWEKLNRLFTLSATATIKAIAIKDGVSSSVAEKTFTKSE